MLPVLEFSQMILDPQTQLRRRQVCVAQGALWLAVGFKGDRQREVGARDEGCVCQDGSSWSES